jgi:hypothetical protein
MRRTVAPRRQPRRGLGQHLLIPDRRGPSCWQVGREQRQPALHVGVGGVPVKERAVSEAGSAAADGG